MIRWQAALVGVLLAVLGGFAHAQCTVTLTPGNGINAQLNSLPQGSTICLNPGTYTPAAVGFPGDGNTFAVIKRMNIIGLGASPSQVVLQGNGAASGYLLWFVNVGPGNNASGSLLQNLTLQNSTGGIQLFDFIGGSRLADITIKDVVINATATGGTPATGIYTQSADRIVMDNVSVASVLDNFKLQDTFDSILMNSVAQYNSNATSPNGGVPLSLITGGRNILVNNTIGGTIPAGRQFAFQGGGVVFYNSPENRFENNLVRYFHDDGVDFHARPDITPVQKSSDNYAGKNTIISQARAVAGTTHGAAMWANCGSDRTWMFGNDNSGVPECGICVYTALSNMALGNKLHDNGIGYLVSGGDETLPFCAVPSYQTRPVNTFLQANNASWNIADQLYIRSATNTEITSNFMSPRNGFGGALRPEPCFSIYCQSAITFDTQGTTPPTNGARVLWNINHENTRGVYIDDAKTVGLTFAYNRMLQPNSLSHSRYSLPPSLVGPGTTWDGGSVVTGGNFWTLFPTPNGNPGTNPYGTPSVGDATKGVFDGSNNTGKIVDRFAYRSENMGRGSAVAVFEPRTPANGFFAAGTRRTVRWHSPGCVYNDILLDGGTSLGTNVPNTGYAVVTLPTVAGVHNIVVNCKDSGGTTTGTGASGNFTVTPNTLQILAPGRDDVFNAGSTIWVAWKKTSAITNVIVELSTNGGATFSPLGTFPGVAGRVTLPAGAAVHNAIMRVRSAAPVAGDYTDGYFAIRGTGQAFQNLAGRRFVMGQQERLEWSSPASSRSVDITATVGAVTKPVATGLPDRGSFDWVVPEWAAPGAMTLNATFRNSAGTAIGTATSAAASAAFPTTITFGTAPTSVGVGLSAPVTTTTNSGLATTLTSLTPSVCTVSGSTVTGQSLGTCFVAANQAGNATYAPAIQATKSIQVVSASNPPRLGNISTRGQVLTGADIMIGGFVIGSGSNKTVAVVATGPSLVPFGIPNALPNPTLQLVRQSDGVVIASNDDWQTASNASQMTALNLAPSHPLESAILVNLRPGAYTALLSGVGGQTGVGIVAVYEVDSFTTPLINISTRGRVGAGGDVMIGGFVIQGNGPQQVAVVATGPSLAPFGIPNPLLNPTLTLVRQSDGAVMATNDDWQQAPNAAAIAAANFDPTHPQESAILITLNPGAYTAILQGVGGGVGTGIIAVYKAQ